MRNSRARTVVLHDKMRNHARRAMVHFVLRTSIPSPLQQPQTHQRRHRFESLLRPLNFANRAELFPLHPAPFFQFFATSFFLSFTPCNAEPDFPDGVGWTGLWSTDAVK